MLRYATILAAVLRWRYILWNLEINWKSNEKFSIYFHTVLNHVPLATDNVTLLYLRKGKYLLLYFDKTTTWGPHIMYINTKFHIFRKILNSIFYNPHASIKIKNITVQICLLLNLLLCILKFCSFPYHCASSDI